MKIYLRDIIIAILIIFVGLNIYLYYEGKKNIDTNDKFVVENSTDYYDVVGIVNKVIQLSNDNGEDSLLLLLDSNYRKSNHINSQNIFDKLKKFENGHYSFSGDKMYYEKLDDNVIKYYVSGKVLSQTMDDNSNEEKYYVIVLCDIKNNTFSIIPDSGDKYKGVQSNDF